MRSGISAVTLHARNSADPSDRRHHADLKFSGLTAVLSDPLANAFAAVVLIALADVLPEGVSTFLPLPVATLGVLLVGGLGDYWAHRFSHDWACWWKLHAVHHAPHRMVALNNLHIHPLDLAPKVLFASTPVLALGFSPEAIAIAASIRGLNLAFQHADVDLRHGPLNWLFSTNSVIAGTTLPDAMRPTRTTEGC